MHKNHEVERDSQLLIRAEAPSPDALSISQQLLVQDTDLDLVIQERQTIIIITSER